MRLTTLVFVGLLSLIVVLPPTPGQAQPGPFWLQSDSGDDTPNGYLSWLGYGADRLAYDRFSVAWIAYTRKDHGGPRQGHPEDGVGWGIAEVSLVEEEGRCFMRASNFQDGRTRELSWTSMDQDVMDNDGAVRFLAAWTPNLGRFSVSCFSSPGYVRSDSFEDGLVRELNYTWYFKDKIQLGLLAAWTPNTGNYRVAQREPTTE